jgi:hypothetical protein
MEEHELKEKFEKLPNFSAKTKIGLGLLAWVMGFEHVRTRIEIKIKKE